LAAVAVSLVSRVLKKLVRSRVNQKFNVPETVRMASSFAAALPAERRVWAVPGLGGRDNCLFEHPERVNARQCQ
jgi:hypothetical protein